MLSCRPEGLLLSALGLLHRLSARQNTHETFWDCDTATVLVQLLRSDSREGAKQRAAQVLERLCADPDLHSRLLTTDVVPVSVALLRRAAEAPDGAGRGGSLVVCLLTGLHELLGSADAKKQVRVAVVSLNDPTSPCIDWTSSRFASPPTPCSCDVIAGKCVCITVCIEGPADRSPKLHAGESAQFRWAAGAVRGVPSGRAVGSPAAPLNATCWLRCRCGSAWRATSLRAWPQGTRATARSRTWPSSARTG